MRKKEIVQAEVSCPNKESVSSAITAKDEEGNTSLVVSNVKWKNFKGDTDEEKKAAAEKYSAEMAVWMMFVMGG